MLSITKRKLKTTETTVHSVDARPTIVGTATRRLKNSLLLVAAVMTLGQTAFAVDSIKWEGAPNHGLSDKTYQPMTALALKNAKVVWVNKEYFKNRGVQVENKPQMQTLADKLRREFAFLIPTASTPSSLFLNITKLVYPDGYGGPGLNGNYGSGRAASFGDFQLKGLGPTTQVGDHADSDHSSGGVGATQAIAEAIWSVILNRETPYGSNQVVALIDTGLTEPLSNGISQPRFLVVREDPLRPAHFITNTSDMTDERRRDDTQRTHENIERLRAIMLQMNPHGSKDASTDQMLLEFADKVAAQWAYLHANFIHHGAVTPSNIDLTGKMLDLSSVTTLPGAMLAMGHDLLPFGDAKVLDLYLMKPFFDALAADPASGLKLSYSQIQARLAHSYADSYKKEILKTAGTPDELAKLMGPSESGERLFALIEELRTAGYTEQVKTKVKVPEQKGSYNIQAILQELARAQAAGRPAQLQSLIQDQALRLRFTTAFATYSQELAGIATTRGWSQASLNAAVLKNASLYGTDRTGLRRNFKTYFQKASRAVLSGWNLVDLQGWIDRSIDHDTLTSTAEKPADVATLTTPETRPRLKAILCRFSAIGF